MENSERSRYVAFDVTLADAAWKDRVHKENYEQRFKWPNTWVFITDEYNKLAAETRGEDPKSVAPSGIKPLNMIDFKEHNKAMPKTSYPQTASGVIGYSKTDPSTQHDMAELQLRARPKGDIRKIFGWPPQVD